MLYTENIWNQETIYTVSQVFQGYVLRLSCRELKELDSNATDGVVRDALPENSTSNPWRLSRS